MIENFCIHEEILQAISCSSQKRVGYDDKMIAGEILSFYQVAEFSMNDLLLALTLLRMTIM